MYSGLSLCIPFSLVAVGGVCVIRGETDDFLIKVEYAVGEIILLVSVLLAVMGVGCMMVLSPDIKLVYVE